MPDDAKQLAVRIQTERKSAAGRLTVFSGLPGGDRSTVVEPPAVSTGRISVSVSAAGHGMGSAWRCCSTIVSTSWRQIR